jgi:F5/8 type C domain
MPCYLIACPQESSASPISRNKKSLLKHPFRFVGFLAIIGLLLGPSFLISETQAAIYYLSTTGSDSGSGGSTSPWKTFGFAIPKLRAGDTLILKNGTYNSSNAAHANISCASNATNGTASQPITVKAENERQAFLAGDGTVSTIQIWNCSFWTIEGLRIESADNPNCSFPCDAVYVNKSNNITFRRNIFRFSNRIVGPYLLTFDSSTDSLAEENEFYSFHRHALITILGFGRNTYRRNYCNARGYGISTGFDNPPCFSAYGGPSNMIFENNIAENSGFGENNSGNVNNRYYGNIALNSSVHWIDARGPTLSEMPQNTSIVNFVAVGGDTGIFIEGAKNTRCDNCTFIGNSDYGLRISRSGVPDWVGDGQSTFYSYNSLFLNVSGTGIYLTDPHLVDWRIDYARYYGNGTDSSVGLSDSRITNSATIDPKLGSCKVWIPDNSPLKRGGKDLNGDGIPDDIGANVLYRYENGVLQNGVGGTPVKKLWDPTTGAWLAAGAIVPGVNDIASQSAFDVHKRLNVNVNGCSFPAGYNTSSTTTTTGTSGTRTATTNTTNPATSTSTSIPSGSLAHTGTMTANSQNFAPDHPVEHLWDGCLDGTPACTSGNEPISSFWVEFDFGQLYDLSEARLYGDADGYWWSTTWNLLYRKNINDTWNTAFTNATAFLNDWSIRNLSVSARYVRVQVFGNQSVPATQARELAIYGKPSASHTRPSSPANLVVTQ